MKRTFLIIILSGCSIHSIADTLSGRVVRVTDGDTIVILDASDTRHKIRLQGIDAPEKGQAYGTTSMEHLSDLVSGKYVVVEYEKFDQYESVLGKVLLGSEDINLNQVRAGMAWHYKKYQAEQTITDRVEYSDAEMDARRHKRGLWGIPAPMPPWDYRNSERDRNKAMEPFTIRSQARDKPY